MLASGWGGPLSGASTRASSSAAAVLAIAAAQQVSGRCESQKRCSSPPRGSLGSRSGRTCRFGAKPAVDFKTLSLSLSSSEAQQRYEDDAANSSCGSCGPHLVTLDRLERALEDALVRLLRSCRRDGGIVGSGGRGRQDDGRLDLGLEGRLGGRRGRWKDGEGGGRGGDGVERGLRLLDELLQALEVLLRRGVTLLRVFAQPVARRKASAGA